MSNLTKLEYLTGCALSGIMANQRTEPLEQVHFDNIAEDAIRVAEATNIRLNRITAGKMVEDFKLKKELKHSTCDNCNGAGFVPNFTKGYKLSKTCEVCNGTGIK